MEALAILSHLFHYVLALLAIFFCVQLYRRQRQHGWLFLAAVFLEPFVPLFMRALRGRPLMPYKVVSSGPEPFMQIEYRIDFPFLLMLGVIGLCLLAREVRRE
jgi:hypothetical protein